MKSIAIVRAAWLYATVRLALVSLPALRNPSLWQGLDTRVAIVVFWLFTLLAVLLMSALAQRLFSSRLNAAVRSGNLAAAIVSAGFVVGSTEIVARLFFGMSLGQVPVVLAFLAIATVTQQGFLACYRALTVFDDWEEIRGENIAVAFSTFGLSVSLALLVSVALFGEFTGWSASLAAYGRALGGCFVLYPVRQVLLQSLLLKAPLRARGGYLDELLVQQRDPVAGVLEMLLYVATALLLSTELRPQ